MARTDRQRPRRCVLFEPFSSARLPAGRDARRIRAVSRKAAVLAGFFGALGALVAAGAVAATKSGSDPVRLRVSVSPESVAPGGELVATFELTPSAGIKLTRYPKIRIEIPAQEGLAAPASKALGSDGPPPPDGLASNYFDKLDPIRLGLKLDPAAGGGRREFTARVSYAYCVTASGYCAPVKTEVRIPVTVR